MKSAHFRLAGLCAFALASLSASAQVTSYTVYDVQAYSAKAVQRLTDSPVRLWNENVVTGVNRVAVPRGQEWQIISLGLPAKLVGSYVPEIPEVSEFMDVDYRTQWLNYDQIIAEWDAMVTAYPTIVSKKSIGTTHNGNTIWAYRIYKQDAADVLNPGKSILILGDTHAREWISPSVVLHIGKKLSTSLGTEDTNVTQRLVDKVALYIVPVFNVDGYKYTWTNERLWRKNRRNNGSSFGVDMNRNYAKGWGGAGSSGTPSSETYRGPAVWSEPENQAIKNYAEKLKNLIAFIDFHSNSGDILYPWSYTTTPLANPARNIAVGNAIRNAILAQSGTNYVVGQGSTTLYVASGSSKDWFYDRFGDIPSYTIEIAGVSFDPPTSTIAPTQDDFWEGFKAFILATTTP